MRLGLKSAGMAVRVKTKTARPPLAKSMQNFAPSVRNKEAVEGDRDKESAHTNPLKMIKEYKQ